MSRQCVLPSLTAMFQFGMPSMDNLETVIADVDEQLSHNNKKIEETLQKLVQATNSLSLDNNYTNIKDAMDSLIQTPVLEECACLTPDTEDVNRLLKAILHHVVSQPNSESVIFEQLLGLASHEGLGLPIRAPKPSHVAASAVSINTISDSLEQENDTLWEDIRSRLKRHFLTKLQSLEWSGFGEEDGSGEATGGSPVMSSLGVSPGASPGSGGSPKASQAQCVECLQSLCVLYPIREVWISYQILASEKVAHFLRQHHTSSLSEASPPRPQPPMTFASMATRLARLVPRFHAMLERECCLHMADVFEGEVTFHPAVQEIYLSQLQEELRTMAQEVWEGCRRGGAGGMSPSSNGSATKSIGASDWLSEGHEHEGKEYAKKGSNGEGTSILSMDDIKYFITIVTMLNDLNQHACQLSHHATWDGAPLLKPHNQGRGNLRGVLKHSRDGGTGRDPRGPSEFTGRGVLPEAIPPPFGMVPGMVGSDYGSQKASPVLDTPMQQKSTWNWSMVFESMTGLMIRSVVKLSEEGLKEDCSAEEESMKREKKVIAVDSDIFLGFSREAYPVCKSVASAGKFLRTVLPLVAMGTDKVLQPVRAGVMEVMVTSLQELYQHLSKLLETFNQSCPDAGSRRQGDVKDLCVLLGSTLWLLQEISRYKRHIPDQDARQLFAGVEKQLSQLETVLRQQVIASHMTVISAVILHDAESHNWSDQRPFFEDERCSYSVQMWHLHLSQVCHQLFSLCPPPASQDIFASVLSESLSLLACRYGKAHPTHKRTRQFRADITGILLITLTHLWSACCTPQQLISPPSLLSAAPHFPSNSPPLTAHNSATCLLAALGVVSAPLPDLYRAFKKGFQKKSSGQQHGAGESDQRLWLAWIRPFLFDQVEQGWNLLPDKIAAFILLKLLANQPAPTPRLALQTLLARDALLASLMMSNTGASVRYEFSSIVQPLIDVLVMCNDHPTTLSTVLLAVIEKQDNWPMFRFDSLPGKTTTVPDWMACLFTVIRPFIIRGVQEACGALMQPRALVEGTGFLETLGELPCGCRPKHRTTAGSTHKQEKDYMFGALKVMLSCVAEDVIALPTPLKVFFFSLQDRLQNNNVRSSHNCVALQVIGSCVYSTLSDEQEVKRIVGRSVPDRMLKKLCQLGDHTFLSLTATSNHGTQEKLPNSLHSFIKLNSDWLQEHIDSIIDHLGNQSLGELTNYNWDESSLDFVEHYFTMQADHVTKSHAGFIGLQKINNLFKNNLSWFQHHLEIPPLLQTDAPPSIPVFNPIISTAPPSTTNTPPSNTLGDQSDPSHGATQSRPAFNPLTAFGRIDDSPFSHDAIRDFPYSWPRLLQSDLGLSETGFRSLLSHRAELQEDACLEEGERKPVRVLRAKFDLDKADLV